MPRIKPLSTAQQQAEKKRKADQVFHDVLALFKCRNKKTDKDVASRLGLHCSKFSRIKKDPNGATFGDVRTAMHSLGASQEDWLRLGGYN